MDVLISGSVGHRSPRIFDTQPIAMENTLLNTPFVADEPAASDLSEKTAWPAYPGENPSKADKIRWLTRWESDARAAGYSAPLRREDPFEIAKLADRPLIIIQALKRCVTASCILRSVRRSFPRT